MSPFPTRWRRRHEDDRGEKIEANTLAGGGHSARRTDISQHQVRISHALKHFLVHYKVMSRAEAVAEGASGPLHDLVVESHIRVPAALTDRSHALTEYYISSSHNTYLLAHQLFGTSSATGYEKALKTGFRCVEIDAWDNDEDREEPKVTHGYTLVSNVPFRAVCETVRDVMDREAEVATNEQGYRAAPILLSLENHCGAHGQLRLVQIMHEVWADRLLSAPVREQGEREQATGDERVCLAELGSKIVVIVEYHLPNEPDELDDDDGGDSSSSSSSDSDDEEYKRARKTYQARKKSVGPSHIIPELAALGVYAQSVKPVNTSWFREGGLDDGPHHHLINVSEVALGSHMPAENEGIARHNARHLMRVFPMGTRISSENLEPVPFWAVGAQICALNWQTFGASVQLNEALFCGTDGYVLKPAALRAGGSGRLGTGRRQRLRLHVAGATDVPLPPDRHDPDSILPYLTCRLSHPAVRDEDDAAAKRKTATYKKQHNKMAFLTERESPPRTDPVWDERLEWEYEENELAFLQLLLKSDDSFAVNPILAVTAVRLLYARPGWVLIRMLDLKGKETRCSLLVRFEIEYV